MFPEEAASSGNYCRPVLGGVRALLGCVFVITCFCFVILFVETERLLAWSLKFRKTICVMWRRIGLLLTPIANLCSWQKVYNEIHTIIVFVDLTESTLTNEEFGLGSWRHFSANKSRNIIFA